MLRSRWLEHSCTLLAIITASHSRCLFWFSQQSFVHPHPMPPPQPPTYYQQQRYDDQLRHQAWLQSQYWQRNNAEFVVPGTLFCDVSSYSYKTTSEVPFEMTSPEIKFRFPLRHQLLAMFTVVYEPWMFRQRFLDFLRILSFSGRSPVDVIRLIFLLMVYSFLGSCAKWTVLHTPRCRRIWTVEGIARMWIYIIALVRIPLSPLILPARLHNRKCDQIAVVRTQTFPQFRNDGDPVNFYILR